MACFCGQFQTHLPLTFSRRGREGGAGGAVARGGEGAGESVEEGAGRAVAGGAGIGVSGGEFGLDLIYHTANYRPGAGLAFTAGLVTQFSVLYSTALHKKYTVLLLHCVALHFTACCMLLYYCTSAVSEYESQIWPSLTLLNCN